MGLSKIAGGHRSLSAAGPCQITRCPQTLPKRGFHFRHRHAVRMQALHIEQGKLDLVLDAKGSLLEGPLWDKRTSKLLLVDCEDPHVHIFDPASREDNSDRHQSFPLKQPVGCIALTEDPNIILAALEREVVTINLKTQTQESVLAVTPEDHGVEGRRFNDGKASPAGVFLVGRKHESGEEADGKHGRSYRLHWPHEGEGSLVEVMREDEVQLPNGLDWRLGTDDLYLNDSVYNSIQPARGVVWHLKVDAEGIPIRDSSGKLQRKEIATYNPEDGLPDGLTLDSEGRIWTAFAKGGAVICLDPQTGKELGRNMSGWEAVGSCSPVSACGEQHCIPVSASGDCMEALRTYVHVAKVVRIKLPIKMPTACTFGGSTLGDLYITTADLGGGLGAGGLWRFRLDGLKGQAGAHFTKRGT